MVLWTVHDDENHARLVSRLFSGGQWKPLYNFSDSVSAISKITTSPSVISHRSGSFTAVWHQYDGDHSRIMFRRYISGKRYESPWPLAQIPGKNLFYPAVASNESGTRITVVYGVKGVKGFLTDGTIMNSVMARTRGSPGDWAQPIYIGLSGSGRAVPQVAMDGEENSTVVWEELAGSSWRVKATRHDLGQWQVPQTTLCVDCSSPFLAVDKAGNA